MIRYSSRPGAGGTRQQGRPLPPSVAMPTEYHPPPLRAGTAAAPPPRPGVPGGDDPRIAVVGDASTRRADRDGAVADVRHRCGEEEHGQSHTRVDRHQGARIGTGAAAWIAGGRRGPGRSDHDPQAGPVHVELLAAAARCGQRSGEGHGGGKGRAVRLGVPSEWRDADRVPARGDQVEAPVEADRGSGPGR